MAKEFMQGLQKTVWTVGISGWVFGICDRSLAGFANGYLDAIELMQLFTAATFALAWMALKPLSK